MMKVKTDNPLQVPYNVFALEELIKVHLFHNLVAKKYVLHIKWIYGNPWQLPEVFHI
jgi:hypothetical protein